MSLFRKSYGPDVIASLLSDKLELTEIIKQKDNYIRKLEEKLLVYEGGHLNV
jgi:hypothetical protein